MYSFCLASSVHGIIPAFVHIARRVLMAPSVLLLGRAVLAVWMCHSLFIQSVGSCLGCFWFLAFIIKLRTFLMSVIIST